MTVLMKFNLIIQSPQYRHLSMELNIHPYSAFKFVNAHIQPIHPPPINILEQDHNLIPNSYSNSNISQTKQAKNSLNKHHNQQLSDSHQNLPIYDPNLSSQPLLNPNNPSDKKSRKFPYNDTKNIPKNFGKAIITFIQKNSQLLPHLSKKYQIEGNQFLAALKRRKKKLHSIKQLRAMWLDGEFQYAGIFREISNYFMRRGSLRYIFRSRIIDYCGHLKYRKRIIRALGNPRDFHSIKHQ